MKILQLVTTYQSLVTILEPKLRLLSKSPEIDLYVVSSMAESGENRKTAGKHYSVFMSRKISLLDDIYSTIKIYRYIKKEKFDIIHTHTAKAGQIGAVAGWLAGIPVVHTYHGLPYYEGQKITSYIVYKTGETVLSFFRKFIFSQNKQDYDILQKSMFVKHKVAFEGNAVNPAAIDENAEHFSNMIATLFSSNKTRLLCVSRLESVKSLEKVLDVVSYLKKNNIPVECVIAGKGHLKNYLNQLILSKGIKDSVRIEYTPYIHSLVAKSDIVLLTSKKEGVPRGLLEAMALKKPIIATDVLGTNELVVNKKTGLLIPYDDQDALNKSVLNLILDKKLQKKYGLAGYERVLDSYSNEEEIVHLWIRTYIRVLKRTVGEEFKIQTNTEES